MARAESVLPAGRWTLSADRISQPVWVGLIAGALALCLYLFGPPGGDAATHLYQTQLVSRHGVELWDNLWYSGRYSLVNYTLLYYPLAVALGTAAVVTASVGVAAAAFARLVHVEWPDLATAPALATMVLLPLEVIAGVYPFLLGLALGLLTLVALQAHRPWLAIVPAVLAIAAHALAFGFVGMVILAWALADRAWVRSWGIRAFAIALVMIAAAQLLLIRAFSLPGAKYIFDPKDLAAILLFCVAGGALTFRQPRVRPLWLLFWIYALVTIADYLIPNAVGGNAVRLLVVFGLPILLISLGVRGFRPRWAAVVCIGAVAIWQGISPITEWQASAAAQGAEASYWAPALSFLAAHGNPDYRVEVVQSKRYWEAYYIAGHGYAMARGWYRQADFPTNAVLYGDTLTPQAYRDWLRATGVHYVLLSTDALDFTSRSEADLLRSGRSGLTIVARSGPWTIYALPDPTPMITPATMARVASIGTTAMSITVIHPGTFTVRVHDTPYWTADEAGGHACVASGTSSTTEVTADRPGTVELRFRVTPAGLRRALLGERTTCPARAEIQAPGPRGS